MSTHSTRHGRGKTASRLAKLTRPRAERLHPRERLFCSIDEAFECPVVWLSAPPGAGKTSLVSSYIERRGLSALWYQVDSADADPGTFFHFMDIGADVVLRGGVKKLPSLPLPHEREVDFSEYARHYFRALFAELPEGSVLVFDNYQQAGETTRLHATLATAFNEIPDGMHVIAISRTEPPLEFSELRATRRLRQLGWEDLKLTLDEAAGIAAGIKELPPEILGSIHERANGWAAGVVLLLDNVNPVESIESIGNPHNLEAVFEYLAAQLLSTAGEVQQEMLMRLSYLPRMTGVNARAITGHSGAVDLLIALSKRNFFVDRRLGNEVWYQFHPLFQDFLRSRARRTFGIAEDARLARHVAEVLRDGGQIEEAFPLFVEARAWEDATELIVREAAALIRQGRRLTLRQWITSLPHGKIKENAWLVYWLGVSQLGVNHVAARDEIETAYHAFTRTGDIRGQLMAAGSMADTFYREQKSWSRLDPWLDSLHDLLMTRRLDPKQSFEVEAFIRLARFELIRRPHSARVPALMQGLHALLKTPLRPALALAALNVLFGYRIWHMDRAACEELCRTGTRLVTDDSVSAADRAWFQHWLAFYFLGTRNPEQARQAIDDGRRIAGDVGAAPTLVDFDRLDAWWHLAAGDSATARSILAKRIAPWMADARLGLAILCYEHLAECATAEGDMLQARHHIECGLKLSEEAGHSWATTNLLPTAVRIYIDLDLIEEAARALAALEEVADGAGNARLQGECLLLRAYASWKAGSRAEVVAYLTSALERLVNQNILYIWPTQWVMPRLPELWLLALEEGIHPQYVSWNIKTYRWRPPRADSEAWPWNFRVRALGSFEMEIEQTTFTDGPKSRHKVLELLKALIAFGGSQVRSADLMDVLWPDSEGDAAQKSLEMTLHRLRKLLGMDEAILLRDGKLSLNPECFWLDIRSFESKLNSLGKLSVSSPEWQGVAQEALAIYRGHLFATEPNAGWLTARRSALRHRWLSLVREVGQVRESNEQWLLAADLYSASLGIDPVTEEFYRRLMICYSRIGATAEVAQTYRLCRQQLLQNLASAPSADTERVYRSLDRRQ